MDNRDAGRALLGTWSLVSYVREVLATGERTKPFGDDPYGYLLYLPEGRMYAIFAGRPAPSGLPRAGIEAPESGPPVVAYAGPYTADHERIVHHVDIAWNPAWTGTDQVRFYTLEGDVLTITTAPYQSYLDGQDGRSVLTWRKLAAGALPS